MKKNERVVPIKNYIYLLIMIIVVVALTFLIFNINKNYQTEKLETSYLANYLTVLLKGGKIYTAKTICGGVRL